MSGFERGKGARGELEVAKVFRAAGFDCDRTPNSGALRIKGDLHGTVPAHVEVKWQETLRLPLWLRQASSDAPAGVLPIVAFRQSRTPWHGCLPLVPLADLLKRAGDRAELERDAARAGRAIAQVRESLAELHYADDGRFTDSAQAALDAVDWLERELAGRSPQP